MGRGNDISRGGVCYRPPIIDTIILRPIRRVGYIEPIPKNAHGRTSILCNRIVKNWGTRRSVLIRPGETITCRI